MITKAVAKVVIKTIINKGKINFLSSMDKKAQLLDKHIPVVRLLVHGYTPEQISDELCLATSTVRNYIQEARDIVGARNSVHLATWFFYRYGNVSEDLLPITKRIGKVFTIALLLAGVAQMECERTFRVRRYRRRDEIEVVDNADSCNYTA